jgi:mono/diheme cytochrome c family protein
MSRRSVCVSLRPTALALLLAAAYSGCGSPSGAATAKASLVERGRYLVTAGACNDCHTPYKLGLNGPEPDMSRALSGHPEGLEVGPQPDLGDSVWQWAGAGTNTAFAGPWGISFAANLTPDSETGLGIWTEEMFIKALREGKTFGGARPLMPPMPWPWYSQLTDEDLKAIFAYLGTVEPIVNDVPEYRPPAP